MASDSIPIVQTPRIPNSLVWGLLTICVLPFLLNLGGMDFGTQEIEFSWATSENMTSHQRTDAMFHTLTGSFTHTLLEWSAFMTAIFTVILAFLHFSISRDITTPIIGMALFCAGVMDAFHIFAADRLVEAVADDQSLLPFTWAISRMFNALILIIGASIFLHKKTKSLKGEIWFIILTSMAFLFIAYGLVSYSVNTTHLPQTMYPDSIVTRPFDVVPLILYAGGGLTIFLRFYRQQPGLFTHSLLLAMIPEVLVQLHMVFGSATLFDNHFNIAHFLKIIAYLVPFLGLVLDYRHTYQQEKTMVIQLKNEINNRKKHEELLNNLTNRLVLATESAKIGIWDWDVNNNILLWDDQMYALYGIDDTDFEGAYQAWVKSVHPDDRQRAEQEIQLALQGKQDFITEFRVVWPDGSVHIIEAHGLVERDSLGSPLRMIGVNREITERKKAEENFRMVVEAAPSGMVMINQAGTIVLTNQQIEQQFGYGSEELLNQKIECLIPERFHTQHPAHRTRFFAHPVPRPMGSGRDLYGRRKDGSEFPVEIGLNPLTTENGSFVLASIIDITSRKREEATVRQYLDDLRRSNQELDDFAYIASHDLKEPLRGIFNYSTILLEDYGSKLNEDARHKCETLLRLSRRMEDLVDSLLYFSQVGRTEPSKEPVDLQHILDDILDSLDIRLRECGVYILIPTPLPTISCDHVQVGEIFRNLITNAMKYNDKAQKWIEIGYVPAGDVPCEALSVKREADERTDDNTIASDEIREMNDVSRSTRNEMPIFYVRDNGIGIREKHLNSIFRIFKRLHGRDKFGGGIGAGLTITKKLVERHGGMLWVESTYGEGTTFYFTLERRVGDDIHAPTVNSAG